jgi:hypothetical protein
MFFGSELDAGELGEIRDAVNRGSSLGSERFKNEIESALMRGASAQMGAPCALRDARSNR